MRMLPIKNDECYTSYDSFYSGFYEVKSVSRAIKTCVEVTPGCMNFAKRSPEKANNT